MIFAGRQYPFETNVGLDIVLKDVVTSLINTSNSSDTIKWSDWNNTMVEKLQLSNNICSEFFAPYVPVGDYLVSLDELVVNGEGSKQFNDVLNSSCYKPVYAFQYRLPFWGWCEGGWPLTHPKTTKFIIGGYTYCLHCGKEECLMGAGSMMCEKCELKYGTSDNDMFTYCDSCGRRIFTEDAYSIEDDYICEDCFNKYCRKCEKCGKITWGDYIHFDEKTNQYLCDECLYDEN